MGKNEVFLADYPSPLGCLRVSGRGASISGIAMVSGKRAPGRLPADVRRSLDLYFSGKKRGNAGRFVLKGTPFQEKVWKALSTIPWGESISYTELARRVNKPKAVRAVASAVGRNPVAVLVPCHRVIGSDGSLRGYAYGLKKKAWLLAHESRSNG